MEYFFLPILWSRNFPLESTEGWKHSSYSSGQICIFTNIPPLKLQPSAGCGLFCLQARRGCQKLTKSRQLPSSMNGWKTRVHRSVCSDRWGTKVECQLRTTQLNIGGESLNLILNVKQVHSMDPGYWLTKYRNLFLPILSLFDSTEAWIEASAKDLLVEWKSASSKPETTSGMAKVLTNFKQIYRCILLRKMN